MARYGGKVMGKYAISYDIGTAARKNGIVLEKNYFMNNLFVFVYLELL